MSDTPMTDDEVRLAMSILDARDTANRPILDRIGREIGYGNAQEILRALWAENLVAKGYPESGALTKSLPEYERKTLTARIVELERQLSESRAELARVRQETLEEAALVCEQYRSAQVMSKYARMSECQAARNAAEQCGKLLRAMKEKK